MIKIQLTKKYIFILILTFIVFILTYINNYFFYNYVKTRDKIEIYNLAKTINFLIKEDTKSYDNVKAFLNKSKPYCIINISYKDNNLMEFKNTKNRHLERKIVELNKNSKLTTLSNHHKLYIAKHSIPNIFKTTIRSITFSIFDTYIHYKDTNLMETIEWYIKNKIYLRSEHVVIFFLISYIIMILLRIREQQLQQKIRKNDINIIKNKEIIEEFRDQNIDIKEKLNQYCTIINPPIDILKYKDIIELDPESIIFKCRKVTEKLVTILYNNIQKDESITLYLMTKELVKRKMLSKKAVSLINTIKAFGNISAHPDIYNPTVFTKEDSLMITNALILLIEELDLMKEKK